MGPILEALAKWASAQVSVVGGTYVMNISIGSPPFSTVATDDTGSGLIWMQCKACDDCFKLHDFTLFDPSAMIRPSQQKNPPVIDSQEEDESILTNLEDCNCLWKEKLPVKGR
ncbi:hypothetical protein ACFE04_028784 [Oxalis oulophora]